MQGREFIAGAAAACPAKIERILDRAADDRAASPTGLRRAQQLPLPRPRRTTSRWRSKGALKLKEISYIHAEGYPAAEMKHGPIALIDENMPVVFIAHARRGLRKVAEQHAGGAGARRADHRRRHRGRRRDRRPRRPRASTIPRDARPADRRCSPAIPLQLLAYHIAVLRGCDVDQPRNLAKSVTVE